MKRVLAVVLVAVLLLCSCVCGAKTTAKTITTTQTRSRYQNGDTIVYVTNTGECYHRRGCSYLKSKNKIELEDAVDDGYRACSRCNPPKLRKW